MIPDGLVDTTTVDDELVARLPAGRVDVLRATAALLAVARAQLERRDLA